MDTSAMEGSKMNLVSLIQDYANYNLWANKQLVNWLRTQAADAVEREARSSFFSAKQTLVHIWEAERAWLGYLQEIPFRHSWGENFTGPPEDAFCSILRQSEELAEYVQLLTESSLQYVCHYSIPSVGEFARARFEMIQHCINHSTYHRGQIVTIGHNVGMESPPMTDYMYYLSTEKHEAGGSLKSSHDSPD